MSNRQPWFCPSCQKHHAPHVDTCPGVAKAVCPPLIVWPADPPETRPWWQSPEIGDDPYIFMAN